MVALSKSMPDVKITQLFSLKTRDYRSAAKGKQDNIYRAKIILEDSNCYM